MLKPDLASKFILTKLLFLVMVRVWGTLKSVMYWKVTVSKLPSFQILNWPYSIMLSVIVNSSALVTSMPSLLKVILYWLL